MRKGDSDCGCLLIAFLLHYDTDNHKAHPGHHTHKSTPQKAKHSQAKQGRKNAPSPLPLPRSITKKKHRSRHDTDTCPSKGKKQSKTGDYIHTRSKMFHSLINPSIANQHHPAPQNSTLSPLTHPSPASHLDLPLSISPQPGHLTKKKIKTLGASHRISPLPHVPTPSLVLLYPSGLPAHSSQRLPPPPIGSSSPGPVANIKSNLEHAGCTLVLCE